MAVDPMDRDPNVYNRETNVYEREGRSSNTLAYLIGGLVVALGLLAFLFYDGGTRDVSTTGSTAPVTETAPATKMPAPSAPATPGGPSSFEPGSCRSEGPCSAIKAQERYEIQRKGSGFGRAPLRLSMRRISVAA